jgi:hypothetical protein
VKARVEVPPRGSGPRRGVSRGQGRAGAGLAVCDDDPVAEHDHDHDERDQVDPEARVDARVSLNVLHEWFLQFRGSGRDRSGRLTAERWGAEWPDWVPSGWDHRARARLAWLAEGAPGRSAGGPDHPLGHPQETAVLSSPAEVGTRLPRPIRPLRLHPPAEPDRGRGSYAARRSTRVLVGDQSSQGPSPHTERRDARVNTSMDRARCGALAALIGAMLFEPSTELQRNSWKMFASSQLFHTKGVALVGIVG